MAEEVNTDLVIAETKTKMAKAVEHTEEEFASVRTGRAAPALVEHLLVDYYGSPTPLMTIAGIGVSDARTLVINPYDRGSLGAIETAIRNADLGVNPSNDGAAIRITLQPPTEERRKELIKVVRARSEEGRVAVRAIRRSARHQFEVWQKQGSLTTDDLGDLEKQLEQLTSQYIAELDKALETKERDLLEV
ncbi:MAG: ribosome recycling factor [Ferrimicrobium sp.]|uniref:ribosome recycling factor n=1 Tax=Ferrimicrobium sp. TaxID=2926050 RepID=UPI002601D613|nr:ribosome recycling factor [Ferrimicrobium sp.]